MNLKEFDYKQFLLEKGERVGLGVAVGVMGLMLIVSLFMPSKGFFSGSPSKNAETMTTGAKQLDTALNTAQPTEQQLPGKAQGRLIALDTARLHPEYYETSSFFSSERGDNPTRRPPLILTLVEAAADTAFIPVDTYVFVGNDFSSILVYRDKSGGSLAGPAGGKNSSFSRMMGSTSNMMRQQGSMKGGGNPMMGRFGESQSGGQIIGANEKEDVDTMRIPTKNVDSSTRLVRQLRPARMAIIAGSFPYKEQLEEFKKKLRLDSISDVLSDAVNEGEGDVAAFRFLGMKVERKEVDADGKDVSNWKELDLKDSYSLWLLNSGMPFEPDDPKYELVQPLDGLVTPRLREFRADAAPNPTNTTMGPGGMMMPPGAPGGPGGLGGNVPQEQPKPGQTKYPDVAKNLKLIKETLEKLEGVKPKQIAATPARFRKNTKFDPFHPNVMAEDDAKPAGAEAVQPDQGDGATIPEYVLARFVDVTVDPGKFYKYRVKVRMANPNYGHADVASPSYKEGKELESKDWFEVPHTVSVPPELIYYACDERQINKNEKHPGDAAISKLWANSYNPIADRQVVFQFHRWVESTVILKDPVPVGEWVIADRVLVSRGEYVGQPVKVDLPVWKFTQDSFVLPAEDQRKRPDRKTGRPPTGVTVNFAQGEGDNNTILIDFDGPRHFRETTTTGTDGQAKAKTVDDTTGIEVLMLSPDGKLLARNSLADGKDDERTKRREQVMDRLKEIREGKSGGGGVGGGSGLDERRSR